MQPHILYQFNWFFVKCCDKQENVINSSELHLLVYQMIHCFNINEINVLWPTLNYENNGGLCQIIHKCCFRGYYLYINDWQPRALTINARAKSEAICGRLLYFFCWNLLLGLYSSNQKLQCKYLRWSRVLVFNTGSICITLPFKVHVDKCILWTILTFLME